MRFKIACSVTLIATFSGLNVNAAPLYYDCVVHHSYGLAADGELVSEENGNGFVGSAFHVNRITGEISGTLTHTRGADSTRILHRGNSDTPFKSIAEFNGDLQLLIINEAAEGAEKAFVINTGGGTGIQSGVCE